MCVSRVLVCLGFVVQLFYSLGVLKLLRLLQGNLARRELIRPRKWPAISMRFGPGHTRQASVVRKPYLQNG